MTREEFVERVKKQLWQDETLVSEEAPTNYPMHLLSTFEDGSAMIYFVWPESTNLEMIALTPDECIAIRENAKALSKDILVEY